MAEPSISVIIPAYNCAGTIAKTIQAILAQDVLSQVELIVVDDGSTDETPQVVQSLARVKYIRQENSGPAAARNRGARDSRGEYLFFTDSDCVPQKDWIRKMMPYFTETAVAVVAGSYGIANPENRLARSIHKEILYRHHVLMPQYPSYFGSFNFAVRRGVFAGVGGFDLSYRSASGEDNDLSYKIIARGYKIYFAKNALVDHFHTEDLNKYLREQYRHGFWRVKMYLQHPRMSRGDDYTFWKDIVEIPAALMVILFLLLSVWNLVFIKLFLVILAGLLGLEIYYGLAVIKNAGLGFFWAIVMLLRAVARGLGFVAGLVVFLPKKIFKK